MPAPTVGGTLIAASVVILVIGMTWLGNMDKGQEHLVSPMVDGVTQPTDSDGDAVEVPPSQPATPVAFGAAGQIMRAEPDKARIIDEEGREVLVDLPPDTTVDTVTGAIVPTTGTTSPGSGPGTTRPPSSGTTATTRPPATTTTTAPTTTTTTTAPTTTTTTTTPDPGDGLLGGLLGGLL